ncbi:MAG: bacillithiol biosynthesis BshC [Acidobacteria bacterium]|nr:bacillithiol biosynthesis BshC [Acidobacteriota bacterium]
MNPVSLEPPAQKRLSPEEIPALSPLARLYAEGDPSVRPFLPDLPGAPAVVERVSSVLAAYRPRRAPSAGPLLEPFTSGRQAAISTGQQCGLLTGPLLTLTKALAVVAAARELGERAVPAAPLFWCASEDHDLVEVTRLWVPASAGAEDRGPSPEPFAANRHPVGELPVPQIDFEALLTSPAAPGAEDARELVRRASEGTFLEAFRNSLGWLLAPRPLAFADAARIEDKPDLVPLACRIVKERETVRGLLARRAEALTAAGFDLQVKSDRRALPLFAITASERLLLHEEDGRFWLKGDPSERTWTEDEVLSRFAAGDWLPSFAALARPLAASTLYPIAATVLGPAEVAYWAQMFPLFDWAGLVPPVILPRPMILPLEPSARRALAKSGLSLATALRGARTLLIEQGRSSSAAPLGKLAELKSRLLADLDALRAEILAVDPNLRKPLDATRQNLEFALGKLSEKLAESAGRADEQAHQAASRLLASILPEGKLAERILTPLSYVERFGRERLVTAIEEAIRWDEAGLYVVDL